MVDMNLQGNLGEDLNDENTMAGKFLTFHLADEDYGIPICYVKEIIGIQKITDVPDMPDHIRGVINLRGRVIPVMDVRIRFALPTREYDDRTCLIVVDIDDKAIGLVVDKVNEVADIPDAQIEPSPKTGGNNGNFILGLGKIEEEVKILLDITRLVNLSEVPAASDEPV